MGRCWFWVELVGWLAAAIAGLNLLAVWTRLGRCNSRGGSFDYATWNCSYIDNYPYVDVPSYMHRAFWLLFAAILLALVARVLRRRYTV
jgi:hypothetical protein